MDREDPRTNGKSKAIQTKSNKEAYIYTFTKREKGRKKNISLSLYIKWSKRATKLINKYTNNNKL